jgi:ankyrin repeat protein
VRPAWHPLVEAIYLDQTQEALTLLDAGLPAVTTSRGDTPLMLAVLRQQVPVVERLLELGADMHAANAHGERAEDFASTSGSAALSARLTRRPADAAQELERANRLVQRIHHLESFERALAAGDIAAVYRLVKAGRVDVQATGRGLRTPLGTAVTLKNAALARALLVAGAVPEVRSGPDAFPLLTAVQTPLLELLLRAGARPNRTTADGFSALMGAAFAGHLSGVEQLLTYGADPTLRDTGGRTALHWGIASSHPDAPAILERLVEHGADVVDADAPTGPLLLAIQRDASWAVERLLHHGCPVAVRDPSGRTPLHYAAMLGKRAAIDVLLRQGAEVNAPDARGYTPLMQTVLGDAVDCAQRLVEAGADPQMRGHDGVSALDLARGIHAECGGREDTLRLLERAARP